MLLEWKKVSLMKRMKRKLPSCNDFDTTLFKVLFGSFMSWQINTYHKFVCLCVLHIYIGNGMEKKEGKECVYVNKLLIYIMS